MFMNLNRGQEERNSIGSTIWIQHKLFPFHCFLGTVSPCQTLLQIGDLILYSHSSLLLPSLEASEGTYGIAIKCSLQENK